MANRLAKVTHASLPSQGDGQGTPLVLRLAVSDPALRLALVRYPVGEMRERYAVELMNLGLQAIRQAAGHMDARAVEDTGEDIVRQIQELLNNRSTEMGKTASRMREGLTAQLAEVITAALAAEQQRLLREFSLDQLASGLSRLLVRIE